MDGDGYHYDYYDSFSNCNAHLESIHSQRARVQYL